MSTRPIYLYIIIVLGIVLLKKAINCFLSLLELHTVIEKRKYGLIHYVFTDTENLKSANSVQNGDIITSLLSFSFNKVLPIQ